jgi:HD-GYP domain-containing protein (c-di-GMP phosphodiesterase class II)
VRREPDGALRPIAISFERVAFHLPIGVEPASAGLHLAHLAALAPAYERLRSVPGARSLWHYTSLESGAHSVYPGHGGYPPDFDPRRRDWYADAVASEGPVWSLPIVGVSTRRIVSNVAQRVRGPDGEIAGVTAIDVSVPGIFQGVASEPRQWQDRSAAMIVGFDAAGGIAVRARERYDTTRLAWDAPLDSGRIEDALGLLERALRAALESRTVGLLRHPYDGEEALWAFAPIFEGRSFLAVAVPMRQIVARASEIEGFVDERFDLQASVAGVALAGIACMVGLLALRTARGVTRPLETLSRTAAEIAGGHLGSRAEVRRRDEIGSLADSVNHMADSIDKLLLAQEESYLQALKSLTKALEAKDAYTAAHSGRVTRYARRLGKRVGLEPATLDLLGRAALVHDLGKIGVSERILNKPAPLDDEEFEIMKRHPRFSAAIMRPLMRFRAFADIAAWHHERWDGGGYPDGLAGEEIPLLARIVAIADAWDAMTGDRIYRKGMTRDGALGILDAEKDSGQFDPTLIRAFIEMIRAESAEPIESEGGAKRA